MNKLFSQIKYHINNKNQLAVLLGTMLEHYDASLYGFMSLIFIPLFFPNIDHINAVLLVMISYPVTMLAKPMGAYVIGRIGDSLGRKKALQISMIGMGISTILMGLIPTYNDIGVLAPIFLIIIRMLQIFFVSGESNGGAIFMLEHSDKEHYGRTSGFFCAFTAFGIFLGALASYLVMYHGQEYWRYPYYFGIITTFVAMYLRSKMTETPDFKKNKHMANDNLPIKKMIDLIFLSSFSRVLYMVPSVLLVSYLPTILDIGKDKLMFINCISIFLYSISMPCIGVLTDRIGFNKMMMISIILAVVFSYPLFCIFYYNNIFLIFLSKICIMLITACFYCSLHPWYVTNFKVNQRYKFVSLSYTIGAQIGAASPALAVSMYKKTGLISSYVLFIILYGVISFALLKTNKD